MKYIIALDQGTTSSRAALFNDKAEIIGICQKEYTQYYPQPGWVEHDPLEIWQSQMEVFEELLANEKITPNEIASIGITNQRETVLIWDKITGEPIHRAIVWQDKRTNDYCEELKEAGYLDQIRKKTGLVIDAYFSGTKIKWILDHVENARERAENGELLVGTIDTWLIWKMTGGRRHLTDQTNASRTLIYNINDLCWDQDLLQLLNIPESLLPEVLPSSSHYGDFHFNEVAIPISGVAGDQQAALFGQGCFEKGQAKNTYGTGCFLLMNIGDKPILSEHGLLTTLACSTDGNATYAFEGSVFIAGAVIQWLRDGLKIVQHAAESEQIALGIEEDEVIMIPAFAGLGVPYWDASSKGAIFGLTRDTTDKHLIKAALQSIAWQTKDIVEAIQEDTKVKMENLFVDGGASMNGYLMQFQSDILDIPVNRPATFESTALGVAYLAGLQCGLWSVENLQTMKTESTRYLPKMDEEVRRSKYAKWKNAIERTLNWPS